MRVLTGEREEDGLAGARIDRIADMAAANKRSIYVYFANKELLFTAALDRPIGRLAEAVPVTEDDLPGCTGRLFDYVLEHPEARRMNMWRYLERPASGPEVAEVCAEKIRAMSASKSGRARGGLLALVVALGFQA